MDIVSKAVNHNSHQPAQGDLLRNGFNGVRTYQKVMSNSNRDSPGQQGCRFRPAVFLVEKNRGGEKSEIEEISPDHHAGNVTALSGYFSSDPPESFVPERPNV